MLANMNMCKKAAKDYTCSNIKTFCDCEGVHPTFQQNTFNVELTATNELTGARRLQKTIASYQNM